MTPPVPDERQRLIDAQVDQVLDGMTDRQAQVVSSILARHMRPAASNRRGGEPPSAVPPVRNTA